MLSFDGAGKTKGLFIDVDDTKDVPGVIAAISKKIQSLDRDEDD